MLAPQKVDFSGVWKRVRLENYENLLAAQGAGYVQRKMAASIGMVHTITMDAGCSMFRLQERGGPVDTDNLYVVDGPELPTATMKNSFLDKLERRGATLHMRKLIMPEQQFEIAMVRSLEQGGKVLKVVSAAVLAPPVMASLTAQCLQQATFHNRKVSAPDVVAATYFELLGPSPNARPQSAFPLEETPAEVPEAPVVARAIADLSGIWQRTKTANFEAFVGASGGGFMQRKLAAQMPLTHTITLDATGLQAVSLHEKGGPIDCRSTVTIGAPFEAVDMNGKVFQQRAHWSGGMLVFVRRAPDNSFELLMTRSVDNSLSVPQLVLKSVHRDLRTGCETEATSWFSRTGASPNPLPLPNLTLLGPAQPTSEENSEGGQLAYADDEEDDDDVAVAKMRLVSTARPSRGLQSLISDPDLASTECRSQFSGLWTKCATHSAALGESLAAKMGTTHRIVLTATTVRVEEVVGGEVVDEGAEHVLGGELQDCWFQQRACQSRFYFEGDALVQRRVDLVSGDETLLRRDLEEQGAVIRLTATRRNVATGEEWEAMSIFRSAESSGDA